MPKYNRSGDGSKGLSANSRETLSEQRGVKGYPFGKAAWEYRSLGWLGTIPVARRGTKAPLVKGVSGYEGTDLSDRELARLIREFPAANIGIRLPWDIIGIDVDAYDDKSGAETLADLERLLGYLPVTWRSTSRDDGVSGIYLYQAPREPKMVWVSDLGLGSGIEIAQYHHRFATVHPSIHNSTGREYEWWYGNVSVEAPRPRDLSMLPVSWGNYLLSRHEYKVSAVAQPEEVVSWRNKVAGGAMCRDMARLVDRHIEKTRTAIRYGGSHGELIHATNDLCTYAAGGHKGLNEAISAVGDVYIEEWRMRVAEDPRERRRNFRKEWERTVMSAMAKAAALAQESVDVCSLADDWRRTS